MARLASLARFGGVALVISPLVFAILSAIAIAILVALALLGTVLGR